MREGKTMKATCYRGIRVRAAVLLGLLLMAFCMQGARATPQLPLDIKAQFGGIDIVETACWEGSGSTWFLLVRTPDKVNRLICYVLENGLWTQKFQTTAALPQGVGRVRLVITNQVQDFAMDRTVTGPILMILQYGTGEAENAVEAYCAYLRSEEGVWELFRAFFAEEQVQVYIDEDTVTFRTPVDQDHSDIRSVPAQPERDLRKTDFTEIPRTPEQATETPESI